MIWAQTFSIACDESSDVKNVEQTALLCRYVNSDGPQEELIELIPLKGQTQGQDICEAVSCLKAKGINTTHLESVSTDGAPSTALGTALCVLVMNLVIKIVKKILI